MSEFIFMLTKNDATIRDAFEVYEEVRKTSLEYIGFKDIGLPFDQLKKLTELIHSDGRPAMLEVVSEKKEDELCSAQAAVELGVDYLLGGTHAEEVTTMLKGTNIKYFPFAGQVVGHPSKLRGTIPEIADSARRLSRMQGVHGVNLLAYRFEGDVPALIEAVVSAIDVPLIVAGSIDSTSRLQTVLNTGAWAFTVGSAIFDYKYIDHAVQEQVLNILNRIPKERMEA